MAASASMSGVPGAGPARWRSRYRSLRPGRCPARRRRPPAAPPRTAARSRNCRCRRSSPSGGTPVVSWARAAQGAGGPSSTRVAGPRLPAACARSSASVVRSFPIPCGRTAGGAELPWQPAAWPRTRRVHGYCKIRSSRLCRRHGRCRQVSRGHLVPARLSAHIHIGRPADGGDPLRAAPAHTGRRVPVAGRRSRDAVQAGARTGWARACCAPWRWTATTRRSVSNSTPSPGVAPCRRRGPDELPTAVVEKPGIAAVHV